MRVQSQQPMLRFRRRRKAGKVHTRRTGLFFLGFLVVFSAGRSAAACGDPAPGIRLRGESCVAQAASSHPRFADTEDVDRYLRRLGDFYIPAGYRFTIPIARIAASDPDYRAIRDPSSQEKWANRLYDALGLENVRVNEPSFAPIPFSWLHLVGTRVRSLSDAQLDELATMTYQAMPPSASAPDSDGSRRKLTWEDFREDYHVWSKGAGDETDAAALRLYERMVQGKVCLRLPPWVMNPSPFPALLAASIAREAALYGGPEFEKLITTVETVIAGKFELPAPTQDNPKAARKIAPHDVRALIVALRVGDAGKVALLEQWLRRALDDDLRREAEKDKDRHPATCDQSPQTPKEGDLPR
jgi:hypothetical protein